MRVTAVSVAPSHCEMPFEIVPPACPDGPPRDPRPQRTLKSSASPLLLCLSRPRYAALRLAAGRSGGLPQRAGGAAIGSGRRRGHWGGRDWGFDMHDFPADFEIPDLEADQIYYQQLLEAAMQYLPVLREAVVIQERRGLPTVTPDGLYLVSEVDQVQGLIVMSGC